MSDDTKQDRAGQGGLPADAGNGMRLVQDFPQHDIPDMPPSDLRAPP